MEAVSIEGDISKQVELNNGLCAIVDFCDFDKISKFKWKAIKGNKNSHYVTSGFWDKKAKKQRLLTMGRVVLDAGPYQYVDHINGNPLDNRRINLRLCSPSQNSCNKKLRSDSVCGYKGVTKYKTKFMARIGVSGKRKTIGYFYSALEAARAYDKAAIVLHGEFARINNV